MADPVTQGRQAYQRRAWAEAVTHLSTADREADLAAADLARLAEAAYLTGGAEAAAEIWERAHRAYLAEGAVPDAVRYAVWLGFVLFQSGEHARAGGWIGRAQRLLDEASGLDCVERGYLILPAALGALYEGEADTAYQRFAEVTEVANRFGDPDLRALGQLGQGQALAARGDVVPGLRLLDEVMVAVTAGEVSPIPAGIIYCAVITTCGKVFDLRRAQEWTAALSRWCADQPDLRPYRGECLVHRTEIMRLRGDWLDALTEVRHACAHLAGPPADPVLGAALYQQAELLRLRGEFPRAEEAYRQASSWGHPVHPGLALLRLAQGRVDDAAGAIRRVVREAVGPLERARVLAAQVEIEVAAGEVAAARAAADELGRVAASFDSSYLQAMAGYADGTVRLAEGDPAAAGAALRRSWVAWQDLAAPYEAAWARLRMAQACRDLADHDTARMELDAARRVFQQLGAAPALARVRELAGEDRPPGAGALTARELEVLRLVASGASNRNVADTLVISEKTVARHVANIFTKLGVSSRSQATAYAYRHHLV